MGDIASEQMKSLNEGFSLLRIAFVSLPMLLHVLKLPLLLYFSGTETIKEHTGPVKLVILLQKYDPPIDSEGEEQAARNVQHHECN